MKTFPLMQSQQAVIRQWLREPESTNYNIPFYITFRPEISANQLEHAIREVLKAHPMLEVQYLMSDDGDVLQYINPGSINIERYTVTEAESSQFATSLIRPFRLFNEPSARFAIIETEESVGLFFDIHHVSIDGTGFELLKSELARVLSGEKPLGEKHDFSEFVAREESRRNSDLLVQDHEYFDRIFDEVTPATLPGHGTTDTCHLRQIVRTISTSAIEKFCRENALTVNTIFSASLALCLGRFVRTDKPVICLVNHGRGSADMNDSIGMFARNMPFVFRQNNDETGMEYLKRTQRELRELWPRQTISFGEIVERTGTTMDISLVCHRNPIEQWECAKTIRHLPVRDSIGKLALEIESNPKEIVLKADYDPAYYSENDMETLLRSWLFCLNSILANPELKCREYGTLDREEEISLLALSYGGRLEYDTTRTVIDSFLDSAKRCPNKTAVFAEQGKWSYGELDSVSNSLAAELVRRGSGPNTFVAIMLPREREYPAAFLAVMRTGAACIPIDAAYPAQRVLDILDDSEAVILVTNRNLLQEKSLEQSLSNVKSLLIDEYDFELNATCESMNATSPDGNAYMIYTSGSTGKPKGVVITHTGIAAYLNSGKGESWEILPSDRVCCFPSFGFDASMDDLLGSLTVGATLYIVPEHVRRDVSQLNRFLMENEIQCGSFPSQIGIELLDQYDPAMRVVRLGGEPFRPTRDYHATVINVYGPTEFTVCSCAHRVEYEQDRNGVPIGRPLRNVWCYVMDSVGRLLPRTIPGELVLAGPQLAREYWKRPEITERAFVTNSYFTGMENTKAYRTGDLVRWNDSNELEYIGRIDNQIKIRGFRIEPGEIENAISAFPNVTAAVVRVVTLGNIPTLCAWFTASVAIDLDLLKDTLVSRLADYMVPSLMVQLETFPKTPNGKIDRKKLAPPERREGKSVAPENDRERTLFELFARFFDRRDFGVTDNLVSMGLNSLAAIKMSVRAERDGKLRLTPNDFMVSSNIRELAQKATEIAVELTTSDENYNACPLMSNQRGVWLDWLGHRDAIQYNIPLCVRFEHIDPTQLAVAMAMVIESHPVLQSRIDTTGDEVQLLCSDELITIEEIKLDAMPDDAFFQSRIRPFDLETEPLCRVEIYEYQEYVWLFLDVHHIIFDGISLDVLMSELSQAWQGESLIAEKILFKMAQEESQNAANENAFVRAENFYDEFMTGVTATVPVSSFTPQGKGTARYYQKTIDGSGIGDACERIGVTANVFFLNAFSQMLHRICREEQILIATVSNGRSKKECERAIGMFVRTLPFQFTIEEESCQSSLKRTAKRLYETIEFESCPFSSIVSRYDFRPTVCYSWEGGIVGDIQFGDALGQLVPLVLTTPKFPLIMTVRPNGDSYSIAFEYDDSRYTERDMEIYANAMASLIREMTNDFERSWKNVPMVSANERSELIALSYGGPLEYDRTKTILDAFHDTVCKAPDAIAVVGCDRSLSYRELESRSRILALELVRLGVKRGHFVALMLPRRSLFSIAAMATFSAGGAYLPLDAEYPNDRLVYMLQDSTAKVLLTTRDMFNRKSSDGNFQTENVLFLDEFNFDMKELPQNEAEMPTVLPEDPAYMIYTSGSTGRPKGVVIRHIGLLSFLMWNIRLNQLTEADRLCCHSSFSFDASIVDLFAPLVFGGRSYIVPEELRQDLEGMNRYLTENAITAGLITTAFGMELFSQYDPPLRYAILGGEKLKPIRKIQCQLINAYGPTEFTVCSHCHQVGNETNPDNIPIGRPVPGSWGYILDTMGRLLPRGIPGELCLAGRQIGAGYWNRPELTAEKFIPNPYLTSRENNTMYRTGDLVRWNDQGEVEYLGRIDGQIKLRGFRIELGEIESAVSRYPGITASVVDLREIAGTRHLCAWFTSREQTDTAKLKDFLAESLTQYMVPTAFLQLDRLPMTPGGKVDRKALPIPAFVAAHLFVPPRNSVEKTLARVFTEILQTKDFGIDDSFFSLGGDSIKAIRSVSKLRAAGLAVSVATIMKQKTIRLIAEETTSREAAADTQEPPVEGPVPLTFIQQWFFQEHLAVPNHFNQSILLESRERVNEDVLHKTLQILVERHDMLRAVYANHVQTVLSPQSPNLYRLVIHDLYGDIDVYGDMTRYAEELQSGISIETGPLFNIALFRTDTKDYLLFVIHHLVVDGVSWRILTEDFRSFYESLLRNEPVIFPEKTASFKTWSEAIARYRDSETLKREIPYWRNMQSQMEFDESERSSYGKIERRKIVIDSETTKHLLTDAANAYHTEVNDLLLCALVRALGRVFGKDKVSVSLEGHGREPIGENISVDRTVGWFTSMWPVLFERIGKDVGRDIRNVKETLRRVPNHGIGYGILTRIGQPVLRCNPRLDCTFNYLGELDEQQQEDACFITNHFMPQGSPVHPANFYGPNIAFNGLVQEGTLVFDLAWDSLCYSAKDMRRLATAFQSQMVRIVQNCLAVKKPEWTASDFGETEWSDEEYRHLETRLARRHMTLDRIYPLTHLQEGMLYERILNPATHAYHLQNCYRTSVPLTQEQVVKAAAALAIRHESLRTSILYKELRYPRQAIVSGRPIPVEFHDYSAKKNSKTLLEQVKQKDINRGFDMEDDSLFRITVVRMKANETILILSGHHIIIDGWCLPLILGDLSKYLSEIVDHGSVVSPVIPSGIHYENVVRRSLQQDQTKGLDYWKNLLDGCETVAELPTCDYGTKEEGDIEMTRSVGAETTQRLIELGRRCDVTLNSITEAVWGILLQRHNNSDDVVFGKVVSGRDIDMPGIGEMVGLFINTIPIRVQTGPDDTFIDLITRLQKQAGESSAFDGCSLADIQKKCQWSDGVIKSVFAFENYPAPAEEVSHSVRLERLEGREETNFGFSTFAFMSDELHLGMMSNGIACSREKMEELFDEAMSLFHMVAESPTLPIARLPIVSEAQRDDLLKIAYGGPLDYDHSSGLVSLIRRNAEQFPERIAVVADNGKYTYREFNLLSDQLAEELVRLGVTHDTFVGVMLSRQKEYMLANLAIFKAGGAYIPMDAEYPNERLLYMLRDSESTLLITTRDLYEQKNREGDFAVENVLFIEEFEGRNGSGNSLDRSRPDMPAYMIYTSGSTGKPKGVMIRHCSLLHLVHNLVRAYELTEADKIVCPGSLGFDGSVGNLYPVLSVGGEMHIISSEMRHDLSQLNDYVRKEGITGGSFPTQLGVEFLSQYQPPMRFMAFGGEKLDRMIPGPVQMFDVYGPTEFTVDSNVYKLEGNRKYRNIPIGPPLPDCWAYVLNSALQLVPFGVAGELCLSGLQIARGYWNRPELTKEKFVPNPFADCDDNAVMYRTGDLVRWNEFNELEYVGRIDHQVKLRGYRIELGEIESTINRYPTIDSSVVVVHELGKIQHLCGYFTSKEKVDTEKLRTFLADSLADYMIPTAWIQMTAFPKTPNGKVDRKSLPIPQLKADSIVPPQNEIQREIFAMVEHLLGTNEFGITTNLFTIGLTSMAGIKLAVALQKQYAVNHVGVSYADIFKYQTIEKLASFVQGTKTAEVESSVTAENPADYDYTEINALLKNNCVSRVDSPELLKGEPLGDLLLMGATGFLGVHVLYSYLTRYPGKVYCLVRGNREKTPQRRLLQLLYYYFESDFEHLLGNRLFIMEGDITNRDALMKMEIQVDTVINCAANVKHFSGGDDIHRINYHGVENLIAFCKARHSRLIQVSTCSIAGLSVDNHPPVISRLHESELYIGQNLDNKYVHSKFMAERAILSAVESGELSGKIMRAGNLMPRLRDGEFQINFNSNSFAKRLKAYRLLGVVPVSLLSAMVEFSPIDETSDSILTLAETAERYNVFHVYNCHSNTMGDIIRVMKDYGFDIHIVEDSEYLKRLKTAMNDERMLPHLSGILAYQTSNTGVVEVPLSADVAFTSTIQYCMGGYWSVITSDYIRNMIEKLDGLGFFD